QIASRFPNQVQRTTNHNGRIRWSFETRLLNCLRYRSRYARTWNQTLQLDRIFRSAALRPSEHELQRARFQSGNHLLKLLIRHGTENDPHTPRIGLLQKRGERFRGGYVVRAIEEKASDLLKAAWPCCGINTADNVRFSNAKTLGTPDRDGDVFDLMMSKKLRVKTAIFAGVLFPRD